MPQSKSSRRWLDRQHADPYVAKSKADGYRARAAYKLLEIQNKDRILKPGMRVVDLGAAPGSWSQVAADIIGEKGAVFALDVLPVKSLAGVHSLVGDFTEDATLNQLIALLADQPVDVVLSDMAPNMTGTSVTDQHRAMYLAELALDFVDHWLKPDGAFIIKLFHGTGFDAYLKDVRSRFKRVTTRKPPASRKESREHYLVATGYHGVSD